MEIGPSQHLLAALSQLRQNAAPHAPAAAGASSVVAAKPAVAIAAAGASPPLQRGSLGRHIDIRV